jgi:hypothetical protein
MDRESVVGTAEAARIMGCHVHTIRDWVKRHKIKALPGFHFYVFDRKVIQSLPKPRIGRPRKDSR